MVEWDVGEARDASNGDKRFKNLRLNNYNIKNKRYTNNYNIYGISSYIILRNHIIICHCNGRNPLRSNYNGHGYNHDRLQFRNMMFKINILNETRIGKFTCTTN